MADLRSWRRRRRATAPTGVDQELWEILEGAHAGRESHLLETAKEIRSRLVAEPGPAPDPAYRAHLRASLLEEARLRSQFQRRPRRHFGLALGAGMGVAGVAMLSVVLLAVVVPAGARTVTVRASVQGNARVPVTEAIQLSFNQSMVETSVEKGLQIEPAVSFSSSWPDPRTLVISPSHDLVPNVSYVVKIARRSARAQNGATPLSNIVIPFGTVPTTATSEGYPPSLVAVNQVAYATGAESLAYAPDGQLLLSASGSLTGADGASLAPPLSSSAAIPTSSATSPVSGSPAPPTREGGFVYSVTNPLAELALNALAAVASPDSQNLAYWTPTPTGGYTLEVSAIGGSAPPLALASSTDLKPEAAWLNDSELLYSSEGRLWEVNLDGQSAAVFPKVVLGAGGYFLASPGGQALFSTPGGIPTIYDLQSGDALRAPGLLGRPAWSPDGTQLAYVTAIQGRDTISVANAFGEQPRPLLVAPVGVGLAGLSYSPTGAYIAYTAATPNLGSQLGAVDVATGTSALLSTRVGMTEPVWSPFGSSLSALESSSSGTDEVVTLQLSSPPLSSESKGQAAAALDLASQLAQLQVTGSPTVLDSIRGLLAAGSAIPQSTLLPGAFDRFYAISSIPASAGSTEYLVNLELVQDATSSAPASFLQEQVTVQLGGAAPVISAISQGATTVLPAGPLVVGTTATTNSAGATTFVLRFNSDLEPVTVGPQSISLTSGGAPVPNLQITYLETTRQVTVTAAQLPPGPLALTVSPPLADVNHDQISISYQLFLPAVPAPQSGS